MSGRALRGPAPRIGVIGPRECGERIYRLAEAVGRLLAERGAILICGGLGGVMEAAARGAKSAGGLTVGILPGPDASDANPYIDIPVVTEMGEARNAINVRTSQAIIAIGGGYGTLSEIALALRLGTPVVGLETWSFSIAGAEESPLFRRATSPEEAVDKAWQFLVGRKP